MMGETCDELATRLSANYRQTDPFDKSQGKLPQYLRRHGILFTMCFPYECLIPFGATHLSGSWINQDLGVQTIEGPKIGLALDPEQVEITCLFPTDAATDARDEAGCGPPSYDATKGSKGASAMSWWEKSQISKAYTHYKNMNFGPETPWEEIDCQFLFPNWYVQGPKGSQVSTSPLVWTMGQNGTIEYQSYQSISQKDMAAMMGHPVCTCFQDQPETAYVFLHQGIDPWDPLDWQEMVDLQHRLQTQETPTAIFHWNEIVMGLPTRQLQDLVTGVFYLDSPKFNNQTKELTVAHARTVAKLFGGKPVMRMRKDVSAQDEDVLDCPPAEEEGSPLQEIQVGRFSNRYEMDATAASAPNRRLWRTIPPFPW